MAAKMLDGAAMALEVEKELKQRVDALREKNVVPGLCVILVGNDPASQTYVANKEKACARLGIHSQTLRMGTETTQAELEASIERANEDEAIHGILVQLPLPAHLDEHRALALIRPEKDVDGFHAVNMGRLARGEDCVVACTPKGALHMLKAAGVPIAGKNAVVIGRSNIVGKPMALLLLQENATVTICHSRTENLAEYTADMVKEGAAVLDVGINRVDGKLCGDVDFEAVKEKAGWISPVPGGVGKMTIAMLMENTVSAAEKAAL